METQEIIQGIRLNKENKWTGWELETNLAIYRLSIEDYQSCCEEYGEEFLYPMQIEGKSEQEAAAEYLGSRLISWEFIDGVEQTTPIHLLQDEIFKTRYAFFHDKEHFDWPYLNQESFLRLVTDKGVIFFTVYNYHNGYYGHSVLFSITSKSEVIPSQETETYI